MQVEIVQKCQSVEVSFKNNKHYVTIEVLFDECLSYKLYCYQEFPGTNCLEIYRDK